MFWKSVFQAIDDLNEAYVSVWEDVCNIESPTNDKSGVDAVGRYFIQRAQGRGWQIEVNEQPVSGNCICITMNPEAKGRPIAISGHMDTVHPVGLFGTPAVRFEGDKIFGPGVEDCKGGIVAGFLAMDALFRCGYEDRPVILLLQSDEENSSITSAKQTTAYMAEKAKNCIAFLNCEGHSKGSAVLVRKGILRYVFEITGKAAHSSSCQKGVSAIAEAAHKILALEAWKDPKGLTCNCGMIEGGTAPNSVPASCTFVADIRYSTEEEMRRAESFVREVSERSYLEGTTCAVREKSRRVSMEWTPVNQELFDQVREIFLKTGLPDVKPSSASGGSDAADMTAQGIPCLDNMGVRGGEIHSKDEYAYVESLAESARMLAAIITEMPL